jgi:ABC-type sugar transport system ATPase subunit
VDFDRLTVRDVSRHFGRRRALAHVSLTCQAGEILGLLGHNGAGKSTLLAILATLLAPSAGEVRYGALLARDAGPAVRGRLGLLGHELQLYPELTASENLRFFARLYGLDAVEGASAARSRLPASPRGPTTSSRDSRGGCGSASRSSARSCTSRGSCCSTSRSPASTRPRRRRCSRGSGASPPAGASSCSRRTTWGSSRAC